MHDSRAPEQTRDSLNVVVLSCGTLGVEVANRLLALPQVHTVSLVTTPYSRKKLGLIKALRRSYRREGPWVLIGRVAGALMRRLLLRRHRAKDDSAEILDLHPAVRHLRFTDFHQPECIEAIKALRPDLGVVAGTYILKPEVFSIPVHGSINLHSGKAPEYRGSAPAFWELYNGESSVGITIHRVTASLDAGHILLQETFPLDIAPGGDPLAYIEHYRQTALRPNGIRMLAEAVGRIADRTAEEREQDPTYARTYPTPDYRSVRELRRRVRQRRRVPLKKRVKSTLGQMVFRSGLYKSWYRDKALIVLFHRVDDRCKGDPISCTPVDFEDFCRFFQRFFRVVSLGQLLDRLEGGQDISRHLVITFDDGYRDNFATAAPILQKLGLPGCFFVATNFMESNRVPWWDSDLGFVPEWMSWDEVRALISRGFEIGAHTMNHVDLGLTTSREARQEIDGSRTRLIHETGQRTPFFSYPYGRAHQITEENRDLVRELGFRCCLSAFGGAVTSSTDLFRLPRVPISPWYISPYLFGFESLRMKRMTAGSLRGAGSSTTGVSPPKPVSAAKPGDQDGLPQATS
jgi:peptidoglycan/xylan/chitin deacetylase (PgdA/CDA1 family)/folate-dependent phosphoribosylglycinamide formyltransferase PurN